MEKDLKNFEELRKQYEQQNCASDQNGFIHYTDYSDYGDLYSEYYDYGSSN